ncbi:hypothetical protein BEN47_17215 [Hymenobacter lapidarius]|uniref:Prolyl-tRNA synthetase n=1 Tax=Hymenobacter lapidarius TaxID=1908237 RepID=A0A1G1SYN4_9BACT|nr:hypothetical protein [Hymenobacter lapidarius]OGX83743.1 hypothetical protein BEN47_17215 [Hymenobacter lapidarius]
MKNLLTAFLPALALLALGGCAGTAGLATSEDDGVYYSSKDRTTALVREVPAQEPSPSANEAANPDYNGNTASAPARQSSRGSDEYYDNTYTYMRGVPSYGVTDYMPYSPYTSINYNSYAWGGGACGFSPYGICDPFYSSFYSPFGSPFGYGPGLSISLGFGRPWGYGGYGGYGFGRPGFGGYGGGFYDPFYYSSPFYGGYYGRGGYYGNNFGYGNNYGYGNNNNNRYYGNDNVRGRTSGHRNNRVSDGRYSSGNATGSGSNPSIVNGNSRVRTDGAVATNPNEQLATPAPGNTRQRSESVSGTQRTEGYNQPRRQSRVSEQPVYRDMNQPADGTRATRDGYNGGRRQNAELGTTQSEPMQPERTDTQPEGQRRRGGFFQSAPTQPSGTTQAEEQPRQQRQQTYEQPRQRRSYEQPREQQRQQTYEQPRQQSYEQPQQRSEPSQPAPSNNGGGNSRGRGE